MHIIRKSRIKQPSERITLLMLAGLSLIDSIITILTIGQYTTDLRPWFLFEYDGPFAPDNSGDHQ